MPQLNEIEKIRYHLLVSQIIFGAGYCIVLYDWIVCLGREIRYIWKAKFSLIKVLYLFCRYWPMVTVPLVLWTYTVPHTLSTCERIFRLPVAIATWNQIGAETVLLARTIAFLGNKHVISYALCICLLGATGYQNWVVFKPMILIPFIPGDRFGVCLPTSPGHQILGFFLSSLFFDTLVTVVMCFRLFQLRREAGGQLSRSPLVQLFVSEGLWYFLVVSIANLVNGLMFAQSDQSLQATAVPFSNMLPPILACRLILDLREHGSGDGSSWVTTGKGNVGFLLPAFLYRSKPVPTNSHISTIRFQNPDPDSRNNSKGTVPHQGMTSTTDSSDISTVSDVQFVNSKASRFGTLKSIRDEEELEEAVFARSVLVSDGKPEGDEAVVPGSGGQYYLAYKMGPVTPGGGDGNEGGRR